ncbi:MAG: DUF1015 family protein, partial [Planctomycetes bacterium]|nr:DUF1015 family protein [Planctomycetota bacterium]
MDIRPFRGLRFTAEAGKDISTLVAPPYDVLSAAEKDRLLADNPYNIVAIDLPQVPPDRVGPDEVYKQAGERLRQWLSEGLLSPESDDAIYVYDQTYTWA